MKLFQNSSIYPAYFSRLRKLSINCDTFSQHMQVLLADRYGAQHLLQPVLRENPSAFLAIGDDDVVQRVWAKEQGMPLKSSLADILRSQIETHRTEVFYNLDPLRFGSGFLRTLPGSVRYRIGWRAAPSPGADFQGYDLMVCNFPSILEQYRAQGLRTAYFAPAFDPEMRPYASNIDRPVDVAFVGGFTRHHIRRTQILTSIAGLSAQHKVAIHLENSRFTNLAESKLGSWFMSAKYRRPEILRKVALGPVFGRELYEVLSTAKIVVNAAIDMAGDDRGNIRCFEAMGTGALLLSDLGIYPDGMRDRTTIRTYSDPADLLKTVQKLLADPAETAAIAARGHAMVSTIYSKDRQWSDFLKLVDSQNSGPRK